MIENSTLRIGGAITLWNLSEFTDQAELESRLAAIGLKDFAPNPRPPVSALKEAMTYQIGGPRILIRPLEGRDGWAAYEETRGKIRNDYAHLLTAKIDENMHISFDPFNTLAPLITTKFNEHIGYVHAADVSNSLVKILGSQIGLSLRPRGAIYWLPESRLSLWYQVASAVEACSIGKGSCIHLIRNVMDTDACRCIQAALTSEIEAAANGIDEAVKSGELGKRALNSRVEEAGELRTKIREFEDILSVSLSNLVELVDKTEIAASKAAILASTKVEAA